MEGYNYLPLWLCDFLMWSGLWKVVGALNLFRLLRFVYGLGLNPASGHFPIPRRGYDISHFRFPAMCRYYIKLRIGKLFGKKPAPSETAGPGAPPPPPTELERRYASLPPSLRGVKPAASPAEAAA